MTIFSIEKVEKKYNAKYVGNFPVKLANGQWGGAGQVFYQPDPDLSKGHKHYFGLYYNSFTLQAIIYDASYLLKEKITAVIADNGELVWSSHRHDMKYSKDQSVWIDGGFDYVRTNAPNRLVNLQLNEQGEIHETKTTEGQCCINHQH